MILVNEWWSQSSIGTAFAVPEVDRLLGHLIPLPEVDRVAKHISEPLKVECDTEKCSKIREKMRVEWDVELLNFTFDV